MTKRGIIASLAAAAAIGAAATFTLQSAQAEGESWTDITLVYQSDVKGKIDPCG